MKLQRPLAVLVTAAVVVAPAVVTIGSAEAAPKPAKIAFQSSAISVTEAAGQAVVTLRRTGNVSGSMTVNYSVTDGSATSGADYGTATPPSLTFAPKVKKLTFTVPIVNDTADEPDETILLTITGTVPAGQVGTPSSATITIVDDDDASTPSLPDDLEGDTSGWTATGLWHLVDDSPCAAPSGAPPIPAYTSATHAFYFGQDSTCTYGDFSGVRAVGSLTSPTYAGVSGATRVTFESFLYTEGDPCQNDIGTVDASYDGGSTWFPLDTCVPDSRGEFNERSYIITPTGDTLRVRFTFDSIDGGLNDYPGWFVDDLSLGFEPPARLQITEPNGGDFGSRMVGGGEFAYPVTHFTVTNIGGRASGGLSFDKSGPAAGDFPIYPLSSTSTCPFVVELAPGESCVIDLRFLPSDTGVRTASLDVMANEGNASYPLTGIGT